MGIFPVVSGFISHLTLHSILYSARAEMSRQKWQAAKIIVAFLVRFLHSRGARRATEGLGAPGGWDWICVGE